MFIKIDGKMYKSIVSFGFNNMSIKLYAKNRKAQKVSVVNKSPYIFEGEINDYIVNLTVDTKPFNKPYEVIKHVEQNISLTYSVDFDEEEKYVSKEIYIILG